MGTATSSAWPSGRAQHLQQAGSKTGLPRQTMHLAEYALHYVALLLNRVKSMVLLRLLGLRYTCTTTWQFKVQRVLSDS